MSKRNSPQETQAFYEKLMQATNAVNAPHFNNKAQQEVQVSITRDDKISPGMFKADPLKPGSYRAHEVTIRAMRKDLFVAGSEEFIDLEKIFNCHSCRQELDIQFWCFCPYCEAPFPNDLENLK